MGNRAVITASKNKTRGVGIYVHWNGGPESILAFLEVAKSRGYRSPACDESYAIARLTGVLCEFFDDGLCVGVDYLSQLDCNNGDNGVYVIGGNWEIINRWGDGSDAQKDTSSFSEYQKEKYQGIINQLTTKKE